jgi:hypothetical protein
MYWSTRPLYTPSFLIVGDIKFKFCSKILSSSQKKAMHCGSVLIKYDKICKKILAIFVSLNKYILKIYIYSVIYLTKLLCTLNINIFLIYI